VNSVPTIIDEKKITISEAKGVLEKVDDPNLFQIRTLEYAKKFSKIDPSKAAKIVNKLVDEFEIERKDAIEVVNCMPTSVEELRAFFSTGRKRLIITSKLEKMLTILDDYR